MPRNTTRARLSRTTSASIYSFPPREPGGLRGTVRGPDAIAGAFAARGVTSVRHYIGQAVPSSTSADVVILGRVTGLSSGRSATFVSCVCFDAAGLISRYVTQICIPEAFG